MTEGNDKPQGAQIERQEFGAQQIVKVTETAATAIAAREKASVEARYVIAMKKPRDLEAVRVALLKECSRPSFADVARYNKPIGQGVTGPSIRFAEAALRCMTNVLPEVSVVFEDDGKRIMRVCVTDLEANLTYATEISLEKTVERRKLRDGQVAISKRKNSSGETVYLVAATEDDLLNKQNALISKAIRTSGLRLVPGDIIEECMDRVVATQRDRAAKDPDSEKRRIIDAFSDVGVSPTELKDYLGHDLAALNPAELVDLRGIFAAIKEGETTWASVVENKVKTKPPIEEAPKTVVAVATPPATSAKQAPAPVAAKEEAKEPAQPAQALEPEPAAASTRPDEEFGETEIIAAIKKFKPKSAEVKNGLIGKVTTEKGNEYYTVDAAVHLKCEERKTAGWGAKFAVQKRGDFEVVVDVK